jgi:hypothetical protein
MGLWRFGKRSSESPPHEAAATDVRVDERFDEVFETDDVHEMRRLVAIGWVVIDERVTAGDGPGTTEFVREMRPDGAPRMVPKVRPPDDVVMYVLGHPRPDSSSTTA